MGAAVFTILFALLSFRSETLSVVSEPVYLSADRPRAERALSAARNQAPPVKTDARSLGPRTSAASALVVDRASGAVLFAKNENEVRSIASITKLMTALIFLESDPNLSARVAMREEDDREGGMQHIRPGESATLASYLAASLVGSANNATAALGRSAGMEPEAFVSRMNEKAWELGMRRTVFADPTGLAPENVSTARDIALLLDAASESQTIRDLAGASRRTITVYPSGESRVIDSTDHLIGTMVRVAFGKTGYLDESLYNLAASTLISPGSEIYAIVLGAESNEARVQDAKNLAVWAESTYAWNKGN